MTGDAEEWREIPGFPLYEASSYGRIRSWVPQFWNSKPIVDEPRILKPFVDEKGRLGTHLHTVQPGQRRRKSHTVRVHRLVMLTFAGPCPEGLMVCHNDGNPGNNHLSNLRYDTHASNVLDKQLHNTQPRGEGMWSSKVTATDVRTIRERRRRGDKLGDIAADYAVGITTIHNIAEGKSWKHIPLAA